VSRVVGNCQMRGELAGWHLDVYRLWKAGACVVRVEGEAVAPWPGGQSCASRTGEMCE